MNSVWKMKDFVAQYQQLDNLHTFSIDQIRNLSNDNLQLCSRQEILTDRISQLTYSLKKTNLLKDTLSEENGTLLRERQLFLNRQSISSQELTTFQNICNRLERDLQLSQDNFKVL